MSNVIRFLELMGNNANLANLTAQDYAELVDDLDVESVQRDALLKRDPEALGDSLGYRDMLWCCFIYAPDEQPLKEGEEDESDKDGGEERESPPSAN